MKIVVQEVKTIYRIELKVSDIADAMSAYYKSSNKQIYPRAFEWLTMDTDPETWPLRKIEEIIQKTFFVASNGDTFSYLADFFGFDGWSNAGNINYRIDVKSVPEDAERRISAEAERMRIKFRTEFEAMPEIQQYEIILNEIPNRDYLNFLTSDKLHLDNLAELREHFYSIM